MPHVSDGELHMVLDGALDLLSDERARTVRSHLESCEDCAARLERERQVRQRAAELLRSAGPDQVEEPPFEELRERAGRGGPGQRRKRLELYRGLAWAASLILALGIGWYAGGGPAEPSPDSRGAPSGSSEEPAAGTVAEFGDEERSEAPAEAEPTEPPPTVRADAGPGVRQPTGSLAVPGLPVLTVTWDEPATDDERTALRILQALPSGDTLSLVYTALDAGEGAPREESAPEEVRELERDRDVLPTARAPAAVRERTARPESVDRAPTAGPEADTAAENASADAAPVEPGGRDVSRRRVLGDRWIVDAAAPLPPDSLEELLRRIDPPPEGG